ncbi:hypothetical protein [Candidatus Pelagibacter sp. Uisw_090]|uniref:hypothetical protein n=1 Tax=Candidatus Pelagibacter sp. Uisw_090 TaxID=3230993 RepID=UPI0039EA1A5A
MKLLKKILVQEADFYGASKLIFGKKSLPICYNATWMHGIAPVVRGSGKVKSDILLHSQERHLPIHLVNNEDTVKYLEKEDIKSIAVGMPYIYTKAHTENKRNKILFKKVFMPPHSIVTKQETDYHKWKTIVKKYDCDAICIGGNDYSNVINKKINFDNVKILKGAHSKDLNSLTRISEIFYSTSEMITNVSGSHLVYAAASGVKVKVIDEIHELYEDRFNNNYGLKILKMIPKKYKKSFEKHYARYINADDIVSAWNFKDSKELELHANYLLGTQCRKEIKIIEEYLTVNNKIKEIIFASYLLFNKVNQKLTR